MTLACHCHHAVACDPAVGYNRYIHWGLNSYIHWEHPATCTELKIGMWQH